MKTVLVFAPHRDDETIGCGGTIAAHAAAGDRVAVVFFAGDGGATRVESTEALAVLGAEEFATMRGAPVEIEVTRDSLHELTAILRQLSPNVIYVPHGDEDDPTHRVCNKLMAEATWLSALHIFDELGPPAQNTSPTVLEYEVWTPMRRPSTFVDITDYHLLKSEAIAAYKSQVESTEWTEGALGLNRYRAVTSGVGTYAEAFRVHRITSEIVFGRAGAEQ